MIHKHELGKQIPDNTGIVILKVDNLIDQQKIESILERINNLSDAEIIKRLDLKESNEKITELKQKVYDLEIEIVELRESHRIEEDFPEVKLYNNLSDAVI